MNRALFAAASGMAAQSSNLEIIAHNLANAGVDGFKGDVATFAAVEGPDGTGFGTVLAGSRPTFEPGKLVKSGGAFDVAIDGVGFFCVCDGRGRAGLTRAGSFERAADGSLRNASGWRLTGVRVPPDALALEVGEDGSVVAGRKAVSTPAARSALQRSMRRNACTRKTERPSYRPAMRDGCAPCARAQSTARGFSSERSSNRTCRSSKR